MEGTGIETAQNVVLLRETASVGDRVVAYILDALILLAWVVVWGMGAFVLGLTSLGDMTSVLMVMIMIVIMVPYFFYHLICELAMDGQSIGKRVRRIKVVRMDGGQPTVGQYLLRWLLRIVDSFYGLGLLVILVNGKGQRIGDLAAGTTVISLKTRVNSDQMLLAKVGPEHLVRYPEALRLSDAQASMIKEVLENTKLETHAMLVVEMAAKVQDVLGIRAGNLLPQQFLETILQDHVWLTSGQASQQFGQRSTGPSAP